ncbi:hypothetical protein CAI21_15210 [Alkalilimnicola ehrlichii]|uniref:Haemin-degrading HemS/ChuX domain-containing protein n=1 Tax=Alkalilimnicola ehrlichii TaxID=351052 RepID=A0A3E0WTS9_9GAMM|nr:ChuX/HutX family heme-like substrate-binding protein [Alkalilimnicola ehrlichii]RFA27195.1 hypothetical protein CAI21_15210 [Alkalilimnicola ehrlichii]RFA35367.1 hypothetical protein CAL65_12865 [Alkalilimnicola ehrlichii]
MEQAELTRSRKTQRERQQSALSLLAKGGVRAREAARRAGLSEAELVAGRCGQSATRLRPNWPNLLPALGELGTVMALTRNEYAVHERHGRYENLNLTPRVGLVLNADIDLRLFFHHWHFAFAVTETGRDGKQRHSFQFFDADGSAVHKVYLTEASRHDAFAALVERFAATDQSTYQEVKAYPPKTPDSPDAEIDVAALHHRWRRLRDTHHFQGMLKNLKIGRLQALRLAERDFAYPISLQAPRRLLQSAAETRCPIMVFVANAGTVQIHSGKIQQLRPTGPWFNVLDPTFNLHLREDALAQCWVVRKPTEDGIVTSLEAFDADGELIIQFFGLRKPGQAELSPWRELIDALPEEGSA